MSVKAVVFDVYGTIAEIRSKKRPYRVLREHATLPTMNFADVVMSEPLGLKETASRFKCSLSDDDIAKLQSDLDEEIRSISLFGDTIPAMMALKARKIRIGLCSNLATPYADPILKLLPFVVQSYTWSFDVGAIKPDRRMYDRVCLELGCSPAEVLMVGDTLEADVTGPSFIGMQAALIDRSHSQPREGAITSLADVMAYF